MVASPFGFTVPFKFAPLTTTADAAVVVTDGGPRRVRVSVYVFFVVPSCAVTTTLIVFEPTLRLMGWLKVPEATFVPFTLTVASLSSRVGVTVRDVVALGTLAV